MTSDLSSKEDGCKLWVTGDEAGGKDVCRKGMGHEADAQPEPEVPTKIFFLKLKLVQSCSQEAYAEP